MHGGGFFKIFWGSGVLCSVEGVQGSLGFRVERLGIQAFGVFRVS